LIDLFSKDFSVFDRPVILDKLPSNIIDSLVSLFREMYLNRKAYYEGFALKVHDNHVLRVIYFTL
jgi:hypothetical protein